MFGKSKEKRRMKQKVTSLHGQAIRYVTERVDDNDDVIGRGGSITVTDTELLLFASGDIIFRAKAEDVKASDLLSGDGVVLSASDLTRNGEYRTVVAYFVYHRK